VTTESPICTANILPVICLPTWLR